MASPAPPPSEDDVAPGFFGNIRSDAIAGLLVFLIAMPLCLAIAKASGFPPIAGIWTAVVGGILTSLISNSQLTIKGPAAGMIVVVVGAVTDLGAEYGRAKGLPESDWGWAGYKLTLGIGVTAGVVQILFGLLRAGRVVDLFPLTPVHGMLASIGAIIIAKQCYEVIGVSPSKGVGPLTLMAEFPQTLVSLNPKIAIIGGVGLVILFGLPFLTRRVTFLKPIPGQLIVLIVAIALGAYFNLENPHPPRPSDIDGEKSSEVGPQYLVEVPEVLNDPDAAFALPDFGGLASPTGLRYLLLFTLIGSLESLLSAKAVELLDPWRRKTDFDRDLLAIGFANTVAAAVGGLPMISEIVRSKANIDNGARSRAANFIHGLCLLAFVLAFPNLIHRIPLAALGAMLVFTGFRLASPREFVRRYKVGSEQFIVFVGTIIATLATDLLIGIAVGIAVEILFHLWNGAPITGLLRSDVEVVREGDELVILVVKRAAVFSNWLGLRSAIRTQSEGRQEVVIDMSHTRLVDHSVMEKLRELEAEFDLAGKSLRVIGLEDHRPFSQHPQAARKRPNQTPTPPTSAA